MSVLLSKQTPASTSEQRRRPSALLLDWAVALLVFFRCAWVLAAPLRSADLPLRLAQDDFFYYLKPAQNLAWHHISAYFDHVPTNGYHPLYFLVLAAISLFVHTLPGIFRFLWVLDTLSALAIFLLTRRLFRYLGSPLFANAAGVFMVLISMPLLCDQMEVTLALPFGLAFLAVAFASKERPTLSRCALAGLLAALTMLSRLDASLLIALFLFATLSIRTLRSSLTLRHGLSFIASFLPLVLLYLWTNHHFFHTLLPISGMAKELRHGFTPSVLLPASINGNTEVLANLAIVAAVLGWALRRYMLAPEKALLFAVVSFPFVFYGIEMFVSDWPIWNWYFYVLRFSALGALLLLGVVLTRSVLPIRYRRLMALVENGTVAGALCSLFSAALLLQSYKVDHWMVEIQHATGILTTFADAHPGVYAMGDRAGMFGASTANPLLQTEGLVMDRAYLQHIRKQENLRTVLAEYGVDYYVAFVFKSNYGMQFTKSCFHAMEPSIAGPDALRMRADFCETPVLQFPGFDGRYLVFKLHP